MLKSMIFKVLNKSKNMIDFVNKTSFIPSRNVLEILESIKNEIDSKNIVELVFVNDSEIKNLNSTFLNKNYPTDVLSFPLESEICDVLGSVVISIDRAFFAARENNHPVEHEIIILFVHGILHLKGFNHESDNGEHRKKESEILKKYNINIGLIDRVN